MTETHEVTEAFGIIYKLKTNISNKLKLKLKIDKIQEKKPPLGPQLSN